MQKPKESYKPNVLFMCFGNSIRSQMAEAWAKNLMGDRIQAFSAGIIASGLHPRMISVMKEVGIDVINQRSKDVASLSSCIFDYVVVLSKQVYTQVVDRFDPNTTQILVKDIEDPTDTLTNNINVLNNRFRTIRDEIKSYLQSIESILTSQPSY